MFSSVLPFSSFLLPLALPFLLALSHHFPRHGSRNSQGVIPLCCVQGSRKVRETSKKEVEYIFSKYVSGLEDRGPRRSMVFRLLNP